MAAYLLFEDRIGDALAYATYKNLTETAVAKYRGRYLARGGDIEVLAGNWSKPECLDIAEFDSVEQAKKFYNSPEYGAARDARKLTTNMNMLIVQGLPQTSVSIKEKT